MEDREARSDVRGRRRALFENLADPDTISTFFEAVADDVEWTVLGTHPLAGTYRSKIHFVEATFGRLGAVMRDRVKLHLLALYSDGDTVIAQLRADSTTLEGARYDNALCWVCHFADGASEDRIIRVDAYLDSAMVTSTLERNEHSIDL